LDDKVLIDLLAELAGREEEREMAAHTLDHHTDREEHLRELQAEYEDDAARAREGDLSAAVQLRVKEAEIRTVEAELAVKRDRIIGISDRRQYTALQHEIAALEQRQAGLESEALLLLDKTEGTERDAAVAAAEARRQAARGSGEIAQLTAESERAERRSAELADEIARLVGMLPDGIRRHVQRLQQDGGRAVVRVESGACGGCFGQLPAQQAIDAEKGRGVVRCAGCARFVVHRPWH
jgi:predicted  nucleic acid-binding Zn-ribbon protein